VEWQHPLEVHYATSAMSGWPCLQMVVWRHDLYGRNEPCTFLESTCCPQSLPNERIDTIHCRVWALPRSCAGAYGCMRLPMQPGSHVREVACWRPKGSAWDEFAAWFRGGIPSFLDPHTAMDPAFDRAELDTVTQGSVTVELHLALRGFDTSGVALGTLSGRATSTLEAMQVAASSDALAAIERILEAYGAGSDAKAASEDEDEDEVEEGVQRIA